MGVGHSHGATDRAPTDSQNRRRLIVTLVLVLVYMGAEIVGGWLANSLALLADAGHMLSDAAALGIALFAMWFATKPATTRHTYGYYRAEILAALVNGASLIAIAFYIFVEALQRFRDPPQVEGGLMMGVAAGGLVVNMLGLWILHAGRAANLNLRGAWLHVLTDALGSVQALAAGALILLYGWDWVDPVASVLIACLVVFSAWHLMRESVAVLMEGAPGHVDVDAVRNRLAELPDASAVRDLHVWTIASGLVALSAHVTANRPSTSQLHDLNHDLEERFGIHHVTIQFDPPEEGHDHHPPRI